MLRLTHITNLSSVLLAAFFTIVHFPPQPTAACADEPPADSEVADDLQRLPTDRAALRELDRLQEAIDSPDAENFRSSLRVLRAADPGLMTQSNGNFQPLHRTLTLLLSELPPELAAARDSDDGSARAELQRTLLNPDPVELLNLLQRCNGTPTSRSILLLLARIHEDRGERAAARYWLMPLLKSPPPGPPPHVLALQRRLETPETNPPEAQQPGPQKPAETLAAQPATIGNSLPHGHSSDLPRNIQWTRSLPLHDTARRTLQEYVATATANSTVPWCVFTPLADQDCIYVRSQSLITALDRKTGRTLWTRNLRPNSLPVNNSPWSSRMIQPFPNNVGSSRTNPTREPHSWQLAMDAERLYVISTEIDVLNQFRDEESLRVRVLIGRDENNRRKPQEFSAIDKQTGRRLWTVGGEPVEALFGNPLSLCWFPGLPVVQGGDVCLLAEKEGQISLVCLTAKDGSLQWQIPIVFPENNIDLDFFRQLLSAQLTVHNGILLASTTTGWSFAIDLLTRSVLWARQIAPDSAGQTPGSRNGRIIFRQQIVRGRPVNSATANRNRRSERPLVIGDEVLWALNEVPQITVTSLLTGEISRRLTTSDPALILWADSEVIVAASASEIAAWQTADFSTRWKSQLSSRLAVPVGTAVRRRDQLLIPAADGSLQIRSLSTGQLVDSIPYLRPVQQPGTLAAIDSDLISAGPGYLTLAAARQPQPQPGEDPIEQAAFSLATNQPAEALRLIDKVTPNPLIEEQLSHLRFRAALCLFARNSTNPAAELEQLRSFAGPAPEQAIATWLRLSDARLPQDSTRVRQLLEALQLPPSVLSIELPDTPQLLETAKVGGIENILAAPAIATGLETLRWPLKSLILQQIETLLNGPDSEPRSTLLSSLSQLPDHSLCSLVSASLTSECLSRAEQQLKAGPPSEITIHLLFAAAENIKIEQQPDARNSALNRLTQLFDLASSLASTNPAHNPFEQSLLTQLIRSLAKEVCQPTKFVPRENENSLAPLPTAAASWQPVADSSWNLIPVNTNGQINLRSSATRNLRTALASDPVLNFCRWTSQPESGEFVAQPAGESPQGSWRLRLQSPDQQILSPDESLLRCGSVVIHRSHSAITAFSLLDHRWLWSRSDFNVAWSSAVPANFTDFNIEREGRTVHEPGRRLAGYSNRWLCLMTDSSLEVLDLLTGEQRWHIKSQGLSTHTFACDNAIIARTDESQAAPAQQAARNTVLTLNPHTGRPLPKKAATVSVDEQQEFRLPAGARLAALNRSLIRSSGNYLVAWDPDSQLDNIKTLEWIDALSLDTVHKIPLSDFAAAQFLDSRLIAVFTSTGNVLLIDLLTAHVQTLEGAGKVPELPDLQPTEIGASIDAGSLYLFRNSDTQNGGIRPSTFYNIPTTLVQQQLRSIDRQTGKLRWAIPVNTPTWFVFDHSSNPVLLALLIDPNGQAPNNVLQGLANAASPLITVRGLSKFYGRELFRCPIVSQFPVPGLRLSVPETTRMELEAFGNRVRLLAITPPAR
jgi:outer membrane protein assembly factor BamB